MKQLMLLSIAFCSPFICFADGVVPGLLNYQGSLTDAQGQPLSGSHTLHFRIWSDAESSAAEHYVYGETHANVPLIEGRFHILLGNGTALAAPPNASPVASIAGAFTEANRFLGVAIEGAGLEGEVMPRQPILSAPYALLAAEAGTAALLKPLDSKRIQRSEHFIGGGNLTNSSPVNVIGESLTLETTGRPVMVGLQSSYAGTHSHILLAGYPPEPSQGRLAFRIQRRNLETGETDTAIHSHISTAAAADGNTGMFVILPPETIQHIDFPLAPGTYEYSLETWLEAGTRYQLTHVRLFAMEL